LKVAGLFAFYMKQSNDFYVLDF